MANLSWLSSRPPGVWFRRYGIPTEVEGPRRATLFHRSQIMRAGSHLGPEAWSHRPLLWSWSGTIADRPSAGEERAPSAGCGHRTAFSTDELSVWALRGRIVTGTGSGMTPLPLRPIDTPPGRPRQTPSQSPRSAVLKAVRRRVWVWCFFFPYGKDDWLSKLLAPRKRLSARRSFWEDRPEAKSKLLWLGQKPQVHGAFTSSLVSA